MKIKNRAEFLFGFTVGTASAGYLLVMSIKSWVDNVPSLYTSSPWLWGIWIVAAVFGILIMRNAVEEK